MTIPKHVCKIYVPLPLWQKIREQTFADNSGYSPFIVNLIADWFRKRDEGSLNLPTPKIVNKVVRQPLYPPQNWHESTQPTSPEAIEKIHKSENFKDNVIRELDEHHPEDKNSFINILNKRAIRNGLPPIK